MESNNKFAIGLLVIVIIIAFGIVILTIVDFNNAEAGLFHAIFLPINSGGGGDGNGVYPVPTLFPTPHPYPSPTPTQIPILYQYLPLLFDNLLENLLD